MPPALSWQTAAVSQQHQPAFCRKHTQAAPTPLGRALRHIEVACSVERNTPLSKMTNDLEQVLFVESGFGCDQHGQNATVRPPSTTALQVLFTLSCFAKNALGEFQKACVRACRNAIEFNSIPSVERLVPGGRNGLKLQIKIGTPFPVCES